MKRYIFFTLFLLSNCVLWGNHYVGRITDSNGKPLSYATIYLLNDPIIGTASNSKGLFSLDTDANESEEVAITFLGYSIEKRTLSSLLGDTAIIVLKEQPIMLEETVIDAPKTKNRNKKKPMAQLLYRVYQKMERDFPNTGVYYKVVSDVKCNAQNEPLAMEQMVGEIVQLPNANVWEKDSFCFRAIHCKRFLAKDTREKFDNVLTNQKLDKRVRKLAFEADSGVQIHTTLWRHRYVKSDFVNSMNDIRKWSVSKENDGQTVLTYVDKYNVLGIYKSIETRNYILDSSDYTLLQMSQEWNIEINIPFGYKLKKDDLKMLNLLNISDDQIEKFRVKHVKGICKHNTIYERDNNHIYVKENNMVTNGVIQGSKDMEIPINIRATQHVTARRANAKRIREVIRCAREVVPIF